MAKISDIWVKLGLKKEGFDKGMDDAAKKTEGFVSKLSQMKAGALAVWAAVSAAVTKFAEDFLAATNTMSDAWSHTMAQLQGSYQQMLANLANMDILDKLKDYLTKPITGGIKFWKELLSGADEAGEAAREMSKAFDAEFELENSLRIQRAKISGELADLQVEMRNMALSPEARMAAVNRYRALLEPLYLAEIETRREMLDKAVQAWMAGSGVSASTEDVVDFFSRYGTDAAGAAAAHPELQRIYETRKGDKANQPIFDAIHALTVAENGLAVELKRVNATANTIDLQLNADGLTVASVIDSLNENAFAEIEEAFEDLDLVLPEIDDTAFQKSLENVSAHVDGFIADWEAEQQRIAELNGMLEDAIVASMSNGIQAITDMMAGLEGVNVSQVLGALMQPLADTAIKLGEMLVAQGIGVEAFKKSLENLQGVPAIAAGAALIAIGSAMRSGIQALANGGGASSTATSYSGGSASGEVENYEQTLTVYVEGKISGSDIVLAGNKTMNKWGR